MFIQFFVLAWTQAASVRNLHPFESRASAPGPERATLCARCLLSLALIFHQGFASKIFHSPLHLSVFLSLCARKNPPISRVNPKAPRCTYTAVYIALVELFCIARAIATFGAVIIYCPLSAAKVMHANKGQCAV
jgi:hypothetical protein